MMEQTARYPFFHTDQGIPLILMDLADPTLSRLRDERLAEQALYEGQSAAVREFLESQAVRIAASLYEGAGQVQFSLPESVVLQGLGVGTESIVEVPREYRCQSVAGLLNRMPVKDIRAAVRQRLARLEQSPYASVAASARLIRYATVRRMVHDLLPAGSDWGEFFLPEYAAFREGRLFADSANEAERRVAALQKFTGILQTAVSMAPYAFTDEEYQRKRQGILLQLIGQGRALAYFQMESIIGKIKRWASEGALNRGLGLSIPYFNDRNLAMQLNEFEVIPAGRTLFVPAFTVLAARREQVRVNQDPLLSQTTRVHLLSLLKTLEGAFAAPDRPS
jgi:hypothetical protein